MATTLKMKFSLQKFVRESTNWRTPAKKIDVNGDFVQKNVLHSSLSERAEGKSGACLVQKTNFCEIDHTKKITKVLKICFFIEVTELEETLFLF